MIGYLDGKLTMKTPTDVYVDCQGVGYHVHISLNTYAHIEKLDKVKIWTYVHTNDDGQTLYGFYEQKEREMFVLLISVSGVGPNTARLVLSHMPVDEIASAIANENEVALHRLKGIGPKTAKRIILDLKDKVVKLLGEKSLIVARIDNTLMQDALDGLAALGYPKGTVEKQLQKILASAPEIDNPGDLIKAVLKVIK